MSGGGYLGPAWAAARQQEVNELHAARAFKDAAPFPEGALIEDESGVRYRVTRAYVPPATADTIDNGSFELVRVSPPEPFRQARSMQVKYRLVADGSPTPSAPANESPFRVPEGGPRP